MAISIRKKTESEINSEIMGKIKLEKDKTALGSHVVNLSKTVVELSKDKQIDLGSLCAKVVLALDCSGSMYHLYKNGTVQQTIERLIPLGLKFDDNGKIDFYMFDHGFSKKESITLDNYASYAKDLRASNGGTAYSPVLKAIIKGRETVTTSFFGLRKKKTYQGGIVSPDMPTFVLFITDGENSDKGETTELLQEISEENVFIQFIGIGNSGFRYLSELNKLPGRTTDNTGFVKMFTLSVNDEDLYIKVLGDFSKWVNCKNC